MAVIKIEYKEGRNIKENKIKTLVLKQNYTQIR